MNGRHAAPGRRWSLVAYLLRGRHRYAGSLRERGDQHAAAVLAADAMPTVPLDLPALTPAATAAAYTAAKWPLRPSIDATVELPRIVATASAPLAPPAARQRHDFRRVRPVVASA